MTRTPLSPLVGLALLVRIDTAASCPSAPSPGGERWLSTFLALSLPKEGYTPTWRLDSVRCSYLGTADRKDLRGRSLGLPPLWRRDALPVWSRSPWWSSTYCATAGSETLARPARSRPRTMTGRSTARSPWLTSPCPPSPDRSQALTLVAVGLESRKDEEIARTAVKLGPLKLMAASPQAGGWGWFRAAQLVADRRVALFRGRWPPYCVWRLKANSYPSLPSADSAHPPCTAARRTVSMCRASALPNGKKNRV